MKCDRCGKTYVTNHNKHVERDGDHTITGLFLTRFGEEPSRHIDLCDDCIADLNAFLDDVATVRKYCDADISTVKEILKGKGETYKGEFDDELE